MQETEIQATNTADTPDPQLSRGQLRVLRTRLASYLSRLQEQEAEAEMTRKTINDITGAYLAGLGLPTESNVDLATGLLTPVESPVDSVNG